MVVVAARNASELLPRSRQHGDTQRWKARRAAACASDRESYREAEPRPINLADKPGLIIRPLAWRGDRRD